MRQLGIQNVVLTSVVEAEGDEVINFQKVNASLGDENSMKYLLKTLKTRGLLLMIIYIYTII